MNTNKSEHGQALIVLAVIFAIVVIIATLVASSGTIPTCEAIADTIGGMCQ